MFNLIMILGGYVKFLRSINYYQTEFEATNNVTFCWVIIARILFQNLAFFLLYFYYYLIIFLYIFYLLK